MQITDPAAPRHLVLDTNAVLDWLLFNDPCMAAVAVAVSEQRLHWIATAAMRAELENVIAGSRLAHYQPDCVHILTSFDQYARLVPPPAPSRLSCRDADDQMFIDLACERRPALLLTRDRDLLALARRARPLGVHVQPPGRRPVASRAALDNPAP